MGFREIDLGEVGHVLYVVLILILLVGFFGFVLSLLNSLPNPNTVQSLCPLNVSQVLRMCSLYNLPHNTVSSQSITCFVVDNSPLQVDGPEPSGWVIANYSTTGCQISGW